MDYYEPPAFGLTDDVKIDINEGDISRGPEDRGQLRLVQRTK